MAKALMTLDQKGNAIQALAPDPTAVVTVAIGAASARIALPSGVVAGDIVRVAANNKCYFKFGDNTVTATTSDSNMPIGVELFKVPVGSTHIAVIQDGAVTGTVTITHMV